MPPPAEAPTALIAEVYRKDVRFRLRTKGQYAKVRKGLRLKWARFRRDLLDENGNRVDVVGAEGEPLTVMLPYLRAKIREFTPESARRLLFTWRNTQDRWKVLLTLTYKGAEWPKDGREVKRHLRAFTEWLRRRRLAYIWVIEFQERGAPHFHFLLSGSVPFDRWKNRDGRVVSAQDRRPGARRLARGVQSAWAEIVGNGTADDAHLSAGTRAEYIKCQEGMGVYLGKYVAKHEQKEPPKEYADVGRFWGASRILEKVIVRLDGLYTDACAALEKPVWEYSAAAGRMGFSWEWKGLGFVMVKGADWFRGLLGQALTMDEGGSPWKRWSGRVPKSCRRWKWRDVTAPRRRGPPGLDDFDARDYGQGLLTGGEEWVPAAREWGERGGALAGVR